MEHNHKIDESPEGPNSDTSELAFLRKQVLQLNERLKEVEKHKSSFLSNMRNEIINPFSSILSLSGNLQRKEHLGNDKVQKAIALIYQETFALDFHLKMIFLAAEIESGECYPSPALMRPEEIIAETLVALDHLLKKKEIRLAVFQCFEEPVWGDSDKIQMIFLGVLYHILMNSHSGDGISVKVYTKENHLYAELYNISVVGKNRSLFDHAHFHELCMFNENIEGIHLSVAKSLTETLSGLMETGAYAGKMAAFRLCIPISGFGEGKDVFEEQGFLFK